MRSDDAGDNWRVVSLPTEALGVAVDPTDHTILYAAASQHGVYKSTDDGASWDLIRPLKDGWWDWDDHSSGWHGIRIVVSPADHNLIYANWDVYSSFVLARSRDGGATWERGPWELTGGGSPSCARSTEVFLVHGSDPGRVLLAGGCHRAQDTANEGQRMLSSADNGTTWSPITQPAGSEVTTVQRVVGWRGAMPSRLYTAADHHQLLDRGSGRTRFLGSSVYQSDDDGQTWARVLTFTDQGAAEPARVRALEYDPARPDALYIAVGGGVRASADGGASWSELGRRDLPRINDLALGIDGRNLYAATESGVYRLRLAHGPGG